MENVQSDRLSEIYSFFIHSPATLIGIPAHILIHVGIQSGNHVVAAQCIMSCRYRSRASDQTLECGQNVISVTLNVA